LQRCIDWIFFSSIIYWFKYLFKLNYSLGEFKKYLNKLDYTLGVNLKRKKTKQRLALPSRELQASCFKVGEALHHFEDTEIR
jgi:hypothetical protein